jgi:hypothetical protein
VLPVWLALLLLLSGPALAGVVWRGDFETGDRSQYSDAQMVSADRLQVVTSPVGEGRYALKATVKQGDDPINSSGNRNELVRQSHEAVGSEYYYRWRVMFAPDFPSVRTWQIFTQWHHDGCCGSPPVEFSVYGEEIRLTLADSVIPWSTPLVRGVWHEFIFHVKWSADPKVGFVELWHNRERVLPKRNLATMYAGMNIYLKLGLYRSDTISQPGIVYHDGFIQATRLEDVLPTLPPSPAPDAGTPDAGTPDAGTPDAGPAPGSETTPPAVTPGGVEPGAGAPSGTGSEAPAQSGCSVGGSPLAALALLALFGMLRLRSQR